MSTNTSNKGASSPIQPRSACRKKLGMSPSSVAIPQELQQAIIQVARAEDRSFSAVVRRAVAIYVQRHTAA